MINGGEEDKPPKADPKTSAGSKAKAEPKAAAKADPKASAGSKAKAQLKAAAKAGPKAGAETKSSASASNGPLRRPAAAKTKRPEHWKTKAKKHVINEIPPSIKVFKPSKLSGFDRMADLCKPVIRNKRAREETEDEEESDVEEEEGEEEEGLNDDGVVNPNTFAPESRKLDRSKKKKFDQLMESGSLPAKVTDMYSAALTLKTGKRDRVRDIINSAIDRKMDGKLTLDTCKPIFTQTEALKCSKHAMFICAAHTWFTYLKCYWSLLAISRGMH